ncbi:MAG: tetratricopeptide repeat protein, partial [Bradyrhizobiaceae bacterium]|nr:tetratricopeptide repeat protein [Bradyrhizobiaceae bacterium]
AVRSDEVRMADWSEWRRSQWAWLIAESANLRAVLDRCRTGLVDQDGEMEIGLRLAASLFWFWWVHDRWKEAWEAYNALLQASQPRVSRARFWCTWCAGVIGGVIASFDRSELLLRGSLEIAHNIGEQQLVACAHGAIGLDLLLQGRLDEAQEFNERALTLAREVGPHYYLSIFLFNAGWTALRQGREAPARLFLDESVAVARALGDDFSLAMALPLRASVSVITHDLSEARELLLEAEQISDSLPFKGLGTARIGLGRIALTEKDVGGAADYFRASLDDAVRAGRPVQICESLEGIAFTLEARKDPRAATYVLGAVQSMRRSLYRRNPYDRRRLQTAHARLHDLLGAEYDKVWNAGQRLTLERAVAYARERMHLTDPGRSAAAVPGDQRWGRVLRKLTKRERQVAFLISEFLTNRQIADRLVVSERTVDTHVQNILAKLECPTRTQVAFLLKDSAGN